ncbi:MBL fold metallo-hydrolase [Paenibacillus sp. NFR01]|uniref:MBL fold metallo-hydrolase n=1 Tax=Paenibacillus sp. NFR01 TaxID=1566279 RepID=UPI0008D0171C|nr:MBL fold metallo-hydrolase [Paenibacillus sp. NFR01]SEU11528.1 Glyoxylase, beta-lactamase superfamily II [Paenibacillus sp. NFR01]
MTQTVLPTAQTPGVYHKRIGEVIVTVLSDGGMQFPWWPFTELSEEDGTSLLESHFEVSPPYFNTNCFLIHIQGRLTLIDTGIGPGIGVFLDNLKAAGIAPEQIDTVLLTHLHADHANGLIYPDGTKVFPNAEVVVAKAEYDYWMDNRNMKNPLDEGEQANFQMAQAALAPYTGSIRTFSGEETEPVAGIKAIAAPGHTPGHTAYSIESAEEQLLIWGDILHNATIQLHRLDETLAMDVIPEQAILSRKHLLEYAATERLLITGMHLPFPGLGHIKKEAGRYVHLPEIWKPNL